MPGNLSITRWIAEVKQGNSEALNPLWQHYFTRLVCVVRQRLDSNTRRVCDEEDIVISAFESFYRAAEAGRFPDLKDRDDLWRLLLRMALRKTIDQQRRQRQKKRGGGAVRGESGFGVNGDAFGIAQIEDNEPTPAFAAEVLEETHELLAKLSKEGEQQTAIAKMQGYTNHEIAQQLGCSLSTIERRLKLIRVKWSREMAAAVPQNAIRQGATVS